MKAPLIIGKNGQLARHFRALFNKDYNCLSSKELDLRDTRIIKQVLSNFQPSIILNLSSYNFVDLAETVEDAFLINSLAIKEIAEFCVLEDIPFIHISTDYVFDGEEGNYSEVSAVNPINRYGLSKYEGEQFIRQIMQHYLIIRTSWLYSSFSETNNFFIKILNSYRNKDISLLGASDSIGSPTSAFSLASFLASIILDFIDRPNVTGTYHFSNKGAVSRYDFICGIVEALESKYFQKGPKVKKVSNAFFNLPAARPVNTSLNCKKLEDTFSYELIDWKKGLMVETNKI